MKLSKNSKIEVVKALLHSGVWALWMTIVILTATLWGSVVVLVITLGLIPPVVASILIHELEFVD